ncbi:uncharacterized protein LOC106875205 [Octopus bimaculoides]|uniref:Uncharacterized protein n=1 Tax=Octopus bimaculoides TaxID=37653 RepID=A0A0L8GRU5_OCTBM|nr:uncharacterized protein LOC106875205 [Octopus bimaculoides]|eukprot:XP_014778735.1 PREDICTED: uncharacterized protein LOC106875205 [Octopus bimaculoides]
MILFDYSRNQSSVYLVYNTEEEKKISAFIEKFTIATATTRKGKKTMFQQIEAFTNIIKHIIRLYKDTIKSTQPNCSIDNTLQKNIASSLIFFFAFLLLRYIYTIYTSKLRGKPKQNLLDQSYSS